MRIPFDSFTLTAVVLELERYVGGRVQGVRQPDENTVHLGLYAGGTESALLLSCHPLFFRAHLVTRRPANAPQPPAFCATLRARIDGGTLVAVRQVAFDRLLEMDFDGPKGPHRLIAELMGKHSNLMLLDETGRVVSAAKWVGRSKSSRPIQPGAPYAYPPVLSLPVNKAVSVRTPEEWVNAAGEQVPPFLRKLIAAGGVPQVWSPEFAPGAGAYSVALAPLGLTSHSRVSISIALEQHYELAIPAHESEALRSSIVSQLERVVLAREVALQDLRQAEEAGGKAGLWQRRAELVLAYGPSAPAGAKTIQAWDYDGTELEIAVDPELSFKDNANALFEKAKHAKARLGQIKDQITRLEQDRQAVVGLLQRVVEETKLVRLRELQEEAKSRRWLNLRTQSVEKEDRPYGGFRIRELMGPGGITVLYGENSEANDHLTLRVARPNDYWLHIRGSASAHVVILTGNKPEKIQKEHLMFAAKVAVQNSPSKHAGYVPVDYTLKKYVRKPKGAPVGTALYTHEKTLHIDS